MENITKYVRLPPFELMVIWLEQIIHVPLAEAIVLFMWFIYAWTYWSWKYTIKEKKQTKTSEFWMNYWTNKGV